MAKKLYDAGGRLFLTNGAAEENIETFYMHTLRFHVPKIVHITLERHNIGVGGFTIQGFERRNKESKSILSRFSNNKVNIVLPNLKRLWDIFNNKMTAC